MSSIFLSIIIYHQKLIFKDVSSYLWFYQKAEQRGMVFLFHSHEKICYIFHILSSCASIDETILGISLFFWYMLFRMMKNHEKRSEKKTLASYRFEMDKVNLEWWVRFIRVQSLLKLEGSLYVFKDLILWTKFESIFWPHDWAALDLFVI